MLEIRDLTVSYGARPVLQGFSLAVQPGEVVAVLGPNGAGKSTLIKAVSGVLPAAGGQITLAGRALPPQQGRERARLAAVVPQDGYLPPAFRVEQAVLLGRTPYLGWLGRPQPADQEAVRQALIETGLDGMEQRIIGELSGGERQRVLLARALAQDTPVLLLDEPTAHLDLQHQSNILTLIRQLARRKPLAVLMVLHDLNHAALFADRAALLVNGRKMAEGSPQQVLTEENLKAMYGVGFRILTHPLSGGPVLLLEGPETPKLV